MQIEDRVFIVTGASSGIGLATATALSGRGAKVALLARSTDALETLAQRLPGSLPLSVDMTQFDRVREAVQVRSGRSLDSVLRRGPSWKRTVSSSVRFIRSSRRRILARTGWAVRLEADRLLIDAEGDTPEFVASLVLQAIEEGQAQYFANDRLRKMAGVAGS